MTSRDFAYWLMGYFELTDDSELHKYQVDLIKRHLALVFKHEIDPSMGNDKHQEELNNIHYGIKIGGVDSEGNVMRC